MARIFRFSNVFPISGLVLKSENFAGRVKHCRFGQTLVARGSRYNYRCHSSAAVISHQLLQFSSKSPFLQSALQSWQFFSKFAIRTFKSSAAIMEKTARGFERLPKSVVPINYEITIKPDLVALVFEGSESITLKASSLFFVVSHATLFYFFWV